MLITKEHLDLALQNKSSLFHDGDVIDDAVYHELFIAENKHRIDPDGKNRLRKNIIKDERMLLCQQLDGFVYYDDKCFVCKKPHRLKISRSQIIHDNFSKMGRRSISSASIPSHNEFAHGVITYQELWERKYLNVEIDRPLNSQHYFNERLMFVCPECISKFENDAVSEATEILKLKDEVFLSWYTDERNTSDWRMGLFVKHDSSEDKWPNAYNIKSLVGVHWMSDNYKRRLKYEEEEASLEKSHREELENARLQRQIDEERERKRVERSNDLFLARKQQNSPTQKYINTYCLTNSNIDIYDQSVIHDALFPENVEYDHIQKHNCALYSEYLKTPLWRIISNKVKWNAGNKCEECGSSQNLAVHHISYEMKGVEFLNFGLLSCLCGCCHKKKHDKED